MGNRALRKQVSKAIKEAGFKGKLYYGNKRVALRAMRACDLRDILYMLSLKPGTIVNDCDAFNHRVKKHLICYYTLQYRSRTRVFDIEQVEFEDGGLSCGCPGGPIPALSREEIEQYHKAGFTDEVIAESKKAGWWSERSQKMYDALIKEGRHICDEDGIKLPEFM